MTDATDPAAEVDDAFAAVLPDIAATYLAHLDHVTIAQRAATMLATDHPDVFAQLAAHVPADVAGRAVHLAALAASTIILGDVVEAATLEATFRLGPASTIDDVSTDTGTG